MSTPFLFPIDTERGQLAQLLLTKIRQTGTSVWPDGSLRSCDVTAAGAVLLLAGNRGHNDCLRLLMSAHDAGQPVRAAILDDGGARLVSSLQMWGGAFDFRNRFDTAFTHFQAWLADCGFCPVASPVVPSASRKFAFISYPNRDRDFAVYLKTQLEMIGWDAWFYHGTERDFSSPSIVDELDQRIRRASGMILVLSEEWRTSQWCRSEWEKALRLEKPVIHLRLRDFADTYRLSDRLPIEVTVDPARWFPILAKQLGGWS